MEVVYGLPKEVEWYECGVEGIGRWCMAYPRRWSGIVCGVEGVWWWCMAYPRRWSGMSVWCGRYMEVVYGVPKEVEWYECVVWKV